MLILSGKSQLLHALAAKQVSRPEPQPFRTGLELLDELAPGGGFRRGAVHELLWEPHDRRADRGQEPRTAALLLARGAAESADGGAIVWSDPSRQLYPPALMAAGIELHRLILLRPRNRDQELWAVAECLRCPGVAATIASIDRLNLVEARRLQLAAEAGGGAGIFLRAVQSSQPIGGGAGRGGAAETSAESQPEPQRVPPASSRQSARAAPRGPAKSRGAPDCYAAATRWLILPAPADAASQRWRIQLVHGHGGRVGQSVLLEVNHETGAVSAVRPSAPLADRSAAPPSARATA